MVKAEYWMVPGRSILADGKPGKIVKIEGATDENGDRLVKFIYVKLDGGKFINPYFAESIKKN